MQTILCQLEAVLRFVSLPDGRESLRQAIAALKRHIASGAAQ